MCRPTTRQGTKKQLNAALHGRVELDYPILQEAVAHAENAVDAERFREHGAEREREARREEVGPALQGKVGES